MSGITAAGDAERTMATSTYSTTYTSNATTSITMASIIVAGDVVS
jgi:hypothetical protein